MPKTTLFQSLQAQQKWIDDLNKSFEWIHKLENIAKPFNELSEKFKIPILILQHFRFCILNKQSR